MKNKLIAFLLLSVTLINILAVNAFAEGSSSWYVKRNGNDRPGFPGDAEMVKSHGGYFIDERVCSDSEKKVLYLTFDAGYENGNIEKILNALKAESVPAAFFVLDHLILKNTDLVKRMQSEGHLVCNHTKSHRDLTGATDEEIARDITALEKICLEKTGCEMSKYFRFPAGKYSEESLACIEKLGYKTIFWSFAYDDWDNGRQKSPESAMKKILDNTHNGAVILLHPTSSTNAEILPELIKTWKSMGYTFGTLDELTS